MRNHLFCFEGKWKVKDDGVLCTLSKSSFTISKIFAYSRWLFLHSAYSVYRFLAVTHFLYLFIFTIHLCNIQWGLSSSHIWYSHYIGAMLPSTQAVDIAVHFIKTCASFSLFSNSEKLKSFFSSQEKRWNLGPTAIFQGTGFGHESFLLFPAVLVLRLHIMKQK